MTRRTGHPVYTVDGYLVADVATTITGDDPTGVPSSGSSVADVVVAAATGVAATDTAVLQAAWAAVPSGGAVFIPNGRYKINAPLTASKPFRIIGQSMSYNGGSITSGGTPNGPTLISQILGVVIEQTTAGVDCLQFTGSNVSNSISDVCVGFTAGLASTGHGINCTPSQAFSGGGKDIGQYGTFWENVMVINHDGDHYGLVRYNSLETTSRDFRSYGGGGIWDVCDCGSGGANTGNVVDIHPYIDLVNAGAAHGFARSSRINSGVGGVLNLIAMIRPQCNITAAALATGVQLPYSDRVGAADPDRISLYDPDFEAGASLNPVFGVGTSVYGGLVTGKTALNNLAFGRNALAGSSTTNPTGTNNSAFGLNALAVNVAGTRNTGLGYNAGAANISSNDITAVGSSALALNTGAANTALGSNALAANTAGSSNTALGRNAIQNGNGGSNNTAVGASALTAVTSSSSTAVGAGALQAATAGANTALGYQAGKGVVGGSLNVFIGNDAGNVPNGAATPTITGTNNVFVGYQSGQSTTGDNSNQTALGFKALTNGAYGLALGATASAGAAGAVAIGTDNAGTGASTATANIIALGTALHQVQLKNNSTGAGSAALGANCPAVTATGPYTWFKMLSSDGSTVYVPCWK